MPRRIKLRKRTSCSAGCKPRKTCGGMRRRRRTGVRRRINPLLLRKWNHKAKNWTVRGRGFWEDFGRGFKSVFKPFAKVGGPILDAIGMPEFGIPLSAVGSLL